MALASVPLPTTPPTEGSREYYRHFFEHHHAVMLLIDPRTMVIEDANPAAVAFYGYSRTDLVGKMISTINTLEEVALRASIAAARARGEQPLRFQHRLASGELRDVEVYSGPIVIQGRELLASMVHDVTARVEAEAQLRRQKEIFEKIVRHLPVMVSFFNEQGDFELVNRAWEDVLGWSLEETRTHPDMLGALYPDPGVRAEALRYMQGAGPGWRTFSTRTKEGEMLHTSWANVRLSDGTSVGIGQDVTSQRQHEQELLAAKHEAERAQHAAEEQARSKERAYAELAERKARLRESEAKFRRLVEQSLVGITVIQQRCFTYANPRIATLLGYDPEDMVGMEVEAVVHPEDRPRVRTQIRRRLSGEAEEVRYTFRGLRRDGQIRELEAHGAVVTIDGERSIISSIMDVTARREAEAELRLRGAALKAAANGIVITDRAGTIVWVNAAFTRLTGFAADDVVGQTPSVLQSGVQSRGFYAELWQTIQAGRVWHGEIVNRRKDGTLYHEEMTITPVADVHGTISHFVAIKQDVTLRKQHEAELVRAKEAAEEMARLKDAFLSNMSHEIRTPLASIIGAADILEDEAAEDTQELAGFIRRGGERLMETLNSVLDLAGLEAGKLEVHLEPLRLVSVLEETLALFEPRAQEKHLSLRLQSAVAAEARAVADRGALGRVLANLLSNAVKFTHAGEITLGVREEAEDVVIEVADTGVGISSEFLPHIFEEFKQESSGNTRQYEGNGLGLTITKRLVELMDGSISVRSELGRGSTFTVRLPAVREGRRVHARAAEAGTEPIRKRLRVLLVDDDRSIRRLVPRMLRTCADVDVASDPEEALAHAEAGTYDAVLLDINLKGGQSGVQVLRALRKREAYERVPVIALTACAMPGDRERYLAHGFDAYVSKPCTQADLVEVLACHVASPPESA